MDVEDVIERSNGENPWFLFFQEILENPKYQTIPDFQDYLHECRFNDCIHVKEPDCAIRNACKQGSIKKERYEHYVEIVEMIKNAKVKY